MNLLLTDHNMGRVGKCWALNYVKRQPELKTRLNHPYDYQRALCEDPGSLSAELFTPHDVGSPPE